MKSIVLIFALLLCLIACERKEVYKEPEVENWIATRIEHIEVPAGKAAIVRFYEDTLALLTETADVVIPKTDVPTKSFDNAIRVEWLENNNNFGNKYQIWQVLAFEDSEQGDYDYNDLVVHVRIYQTASHTEFAIHPIALGSSKTIKLGVTTGNQDIILTEDCREELFDGLAGFVNTVTGDWHKFETAKYFKKGIPCTFGKDINWFIEVDGGRRLYAVSRNYPALNSQHMAYGLILMNINDFYTFGNEKSCGGDWFVYPQERVHIREVYPKFDLLINSGASFREIFSKPEGRYFPCINADANRVVTAESCLYAVSIL